MLWFIVLAIVLAVCITITVYNNTNSAWGDGTGFLCGCAWTVFVGMSVILFGCLGVNQHDTKIATATLEEEYNGLIYKVEALNNGLSDELGLNNNDIVNEIKNYNKTVIKLQSNNNSAWTGVFYYDGVDNLVLIDYSNIQFN